jgi:2-oxoglutarate dehydrogenase complex dehydrogenase (E1) component-like enzyme
MSASFGADVKRLKNVSSVWVDDADFKDVSGTATLTSSESTKINSIVSQAKAELKTAKSFLNDLNNQQKIISDLNIYVNSKVKQGTISLSNKEFINWVNDKIQKKIDGLTSEAAIKKRESTRKQMLDYLKSKNKEMDSIFSLHALLIEGKIILLRKMESVKTIGTFIQTSNGLEVTKPEGFVAVDKISNNAVKIVDRLEFSRANFNVAKDWVKG